MRSYWLKYKEYIILGGGILLFYLCLFAVGITCPIKYLTGVSCPGCGMSRALFHMMRFDFASAFHYHPLCFLLPLVAVLLFVFWFRKKKTHFSITVCSFALLMIGVYVYRLFFLPQEIVVFSPAESFFAKFFNLITNLFSVE